MVAFGPGATSMNRVWLNVSVPPDSVPEKPLPAPSPSDSEPPAVP
jgi:hypothetical protein